MHALPSLTSQVLLPDEDATRALGADLAARVLPGSLIFLEGDLGAGKTTFAQGFLRARGWTGTVRSPSYPIVRTYPVAPVVHHLDLYRLGGLEEVLGLDFERMLDGSDILLVEWPDRMEGQFPPDWTVHLDIAGDARRASISRHVGRR